MKHDKVMSASEEMTWDIAQAAAHWLREHGYLVRWDGDTGCYRVMLEGISREDDRAYPAEFSTVQAAYWRAFQLVAGEAKLPR